MGNQPAVRPVPVSDELRGWAARAVGVGTAVVGGLKGKPLPGPAISAAGVVAVQPTRDVVVDDVANG